MSQCMDCGAASERPLCSACEAELYAADLVLGPDSFADWTIEDEVLNVRAKFWGVGEHDFVPQEMASYVLTDERGQVIWVTHGSKDGRLMVAPDRPVDVVVCCYPGAVKRNYPDLPIVGDWDSPTLTYFTDGVLRVAESEEVERPTF